MDWYFQAIIVIFGGTICGLRIMFPDPLLRPSFFGGSLILLAAGLVGVEVGFVWRGRLRLAKIVGFVGLTTAVIGGLLGLITIFQ